MTSILGAIHDNYTDYVAYCRVNKIKPLLEHEGNFYKTEEWKASEKIPHFSGCLEMKLEEMAKEKN